MPRSRIAVLIPCFNEAGTIGSVIREFQNQLPGADIFVCDNNSTDSTLQAARDAGARVGYERRQGKGYALRAMFRSIEADVYVIVDGDGTYPADRVQSLIRPVLDNEADMVVGSRLHPHSVSRFQWLRRAANHIFRRVLNTLFGVEVTDLLSGYRALSRQVVKQLPLLSRGFEIETELTVKCLEHRFRVVEIPVDLVARQPGSRSKIHPLRDGMLILSTLFALARDYKPLSSFGVPGACLIVLGLVPGFIVIREYLSTGVILRMPSAVLAAALVLSGLLVAFIGLVLHSLSRRFQELSLQMQMLMDKQESESLQAAPVQTSPEPDQNEMLQV